ncbi:MAG TPA: DMT family transporter [Candidatus Cottocaccamicrobium excrementipullorum]|nr:DMT family transporter [Candidatus Cottocaccamicrobium excrementipullorum]
MTGILIALLSGALMSIQGVMNTEVTKQSSIWAAAGWVQLSAFVVCGVMWLIQGRQPLSALWQVEPKYMLLGGILGALITYTVIRSMDSLGPAQAALIIVVSQIVVAYVIELFGILGVEKAGFQWQKAVGALVAVAGIILFKRS